jgi:hypothetical protein
LPDPIPLSSSVLNDAMSALYGLQSQQRQHDLTFGKGRVDEQQKQEKRAYEDEKKAIAKAEEADSKHSFWSSLESGALAVAKVALVVGAAATTIATAGAGSPLIVGAALALSAGSTVVSETKCFGSASQWVALGLGVAGAGVGVAGTLASAAASGAMRSLAEVGGVATAVGGSAEVGAGAAHVVAGNYAADAQNADADAEKAKKQGERLQQAAQWVIDEMKQDDKAHEAALQTLQGAMQTNDQTAVAAVFIRG